MSDQTIICIRDVNKSFKSKVVLDHINLSINKNEVFGIMGPNGSGKTVLINTLLGLLTPDSGSIEILGKPLSKNLKFIHSQVNAASAYYRLQDEISIMDNLLTYARLYDVPRPVEKIKKLLDLLDLNSFVANDRKISTLSSGENSRLVLCKSLINDPKILFLDEPTASLDPVSSTKIIETITHIHQKLGTTIVLASHNLNEISSICSRVCFIKNGAIIKIANGKKAKSMIDLYQTT